LRKEWNPANENRRGKINVVSRESKQRAWARAGKIFGGARIPWTHEQKSRVMYKEIGREKQALTTRFRTGEEEGPRHHEPAHVTRKIMIWLMMMAHGRMSARQQQKESRAWHPGCTWKNEIFCASKNQSEKPDTRVVGKLRPVRRASTKKTKSRSSGRTMKKIQGNQHKN
jgi:hypothetical protein